MADGHTSECGLNSRTASKRMMAGGEVSTGYWNGLTTDEVQIAGRWHTNTVSLWYRQKTEEFKGHISFKIVL